jgi:hypothetical protein
MKTCELIGQPLHYAVALCLGKGIDLEDPRDPWLTVDGIADLPLHAYTPSTDWGQGGPIIEREEILVGPSPFPTGKDGKFAAGLGCDWDTCSFVATGPTPLVAAMRCFVQSRLGHEVDIPEELLK